MSVENIDSASPSGGFPEQKETTNNTCKKADKEEREASPQAVASAPSVMAAEFSVPTESKTPIRAETMEWIDNLNENELMRMFTLDDVPFLASFLAVSSWSSSSRGHTDRPSGTSVGEY